MAIDYLFNTKIFSSGGGCTSVHDNGGGAPPTLTQVFILKRSRRTHPNAPSIMLPSVPRDRRDNSTLDERARLCYYILKE